MIKKEKYPTKNKLEVEQLFYVNESKLPIDFFNAGLIRRKFSEGDSTTCKKYLEEMKSFIWRLLLFR